MLEEKVGQLFMFGFPGREVTPGLEESLARLRPAGLIYFDRNIADPAQTRNLSRDLVALARRLGLPPLLIAADQEGGTVLRLRQGATPIPSAMALGATGDLQLVEQAARITARELLAVGINMNLAPVLDVNNNPFNPVIGTRSFGSDPGDVATLGAAAVSGYQGAGVLATAKHFPGHGDTHVDSHLDLPTVLHDAPRLEEVDLVPFRAAVAAGVGAVMTAHVIYPHLQPGVPATVSPAIIRDLLREKLGFDGLVVTDCLEMGAIKNHLGTARAAVQAILAGADLALISHDRTEQETAFHAVLEAARSGVLPLSRVDEAVGRVLRAKRRLPGAWPSLTELGNASSLAWARHTFARTITLVRAGPGFPVQDQVLVITMEGGRRILAGDVQDSPMSRALSVHLKVCHVRLDQMAHWPRHLPVVVQSTNTRTDPELAAGILHISRRHPTAVVAVHSPYDLLAFPGVETYLCTYSSQPFALEAAAGVLAGRTDPGGMLPVSLPGVHPRKHRSQWR